LKKAEPTIQPTRVQGNGLDHAARGIKAAQKTIAHYNGTYIAMLKNWIGEVRARDGDQLGL
jgi:hypothetical protein